MELLVEKWSAELRELAGIAETQPHAAYTVFTKGHRPRWTYHIRSIRSPPEMFSALDDTINTEIVTARSVRMCMSI